MSTKNTWKTFGGIYKTQEITNLGIGTVVVDEVISRKKIIETLVFEQILSLKNDYIQTNGDINTYGTGKFNLNTFHNDNVFVKNKIIFAGGNTILREDQDQDAQDALEVTVGGDFVVPNAGNAINFLYGDVTLNRLSIGTTVPTSFFHIYQPITDTINHSLFTIETNKSSARVELLKTNNSSGMIDISSNSSITQQRFIASNSVNGSFISKGDIFSIVNNDSYKSIHINAYDTSINSTVNTEITSLNNTIINSQYTQVKGKSVFSNKNNTNERLNETVVIYDNNVNSYLSDYYNVNVDDYSSGNALTISSSDASSNAFQHIITPNFKGIGIGGGTIINDNTKSMGTIGVLIDDSSSTDSSFVPGITLYETGNKAVNRSVIGINTFLPNTTSHTMTINGPIRIGHGELHIRAYANFYINNVSFSKQDPLYGSASGKTNSSTNPYNYYYLETRDGGENWSIYNMDNNTFRSYPNLLLSTYSNGLRNSSNKSYLIDKNNNNVGFVEKGNNVSTGWSVNTSIQNVSISLFHVNYNQVSNPPEYQIIAKDYYIPGSNQTAVNLTNIYIPGNNYIDLATTEYGYILHNINNILGISGDNNIFYILGVNSQNQIIIIKYNAYTFSIQYDYYHNTTVNLSGIPVIYAYSTNSIVVVGNNFITYSNNASITSELTQYGQTLFGNYNSDSNTLFGLSVAMSADGLTIVVGAPGERNAFYQGTVRVYSYDIDLGQWVQKGQTLEGPVAYPNFGHSVDINDQGDRIVVTVPGISDRMYIYDYNSSTNVWDRILDSRVWFEGSSLHYTRMSGDGMSIILGDNGTYRSNKGITAVYRLSSADDIWYRTFFQQGDNNNYYNGPGQSITYDGNRITFIEPLYSSGSLVNQGRVRIYDYNGSAWTNTITIYGESNYEYLADASDFSKDGTVLALAAGNLGYVKVFNLSGNNAIQKGATLIFSSYQGSSSANVRISDDGNILFISFSLADENNFTDNGIAYIYKFFNGEWRIQSGTFIRGLYNNSQIGYKHNIGLAISGDGTKIIIGGGYAEIGSSYGEGYAICYSTNVVKGATWHTLSNTGYNLTQLHLPNERNAIAFGTRISDSQPILLYSNDYYHTWQEVDEYTLNASGMKHIMTDALNGTNVSIHMSGLNTIVVSYVVSNTESRIVYGHFPNLLNKEHHSVLDISGNMRISGVVYQF